MARHDPVTGGTTRRPSAVSAPKTPKPQTGNPSAVTTGKPQGIARNQGVVKSGKRK